MKETKINDVEVAGKKEERLTISRPNFRTAEFEIRGDEVPLVVHRFTLKAKQEIRDKMAAGTTANVKRKVREPKDFDLMFNDARYISDKGWDGFPASAVRNAMIAACRVTDYKMTQMKMTVFVLADGYDKTEPQIPLVRILNCKPIKQEDVARVATGEPYVIARPAYHNWKALLRIRWDDDQFKASDVGNLLMRAGMQVGLCEGRPFSKDSAGMDWGRFSVAFNEPAKVAA